MEIDTTIKKIFSSYLQSGNLAEFQRDINIRCAELQGLIIWDRVQEIIKEGIKNIDFQAGIATREDIEKEFRIK